MTAPKLWSAVVAQDRAVALLDAAAREPVHAYLFLGPRGSTKTEAARAFSAALLCPNGGCGECRDCRLALSGEHPDVQLIAREGAAISAAQAEDIVRRAALAPVEGRRKVLVLDEFHLLRPEAAARWWPRRRSARRRARAGVARRWRARRSRAVRPARWPP